MQNPSTSSLPYQPHTKSLENSKTFYPNTGSTGMLCCWPREKLIDDKKLGDVCRKQAKTATVASRLARTKWAVLYPRRLAVRLDTKQLILPGRFPLHHSFTTHFASSSKPGLNLSMRW